MIGTRWFGLLAVLFMVLGPASGDPHEAGEELRVTGDPATVEFLAPILRERGWATRPSRPIRPGECWEDRRGNRVVNLDWKPPPHSVTALSDHPEKVENRGGLFFGGLVRLRPLNFQYYHLGKLEGAAPNLSLYLHNPAATPATVYVRRGVGRPSLDYFSTGHTNNVEWFKAKNQNLGYFRTVGPQETVEVFSQPLPLEYVVSGTLGLTLTEGPPLQFAFVARTNSDEPPSLNNLLKEGDVHSRGFYPAAVQRVERTFRVGRQPLNIALGAVRQQTFSGVRELRGDYGVTYQMDLTLVNDTSESAKVEFLFNPRGGAATGTFLVDGRLLEVENTAAFEERQFHHLKLQPHERKRILLDTIPEGASSYPVRIIVR